MVVGAAAGGAIAGILIGRNIAATQKGIAQAVESWPQLAGFAFSLEPTSGLGATTGKERPVLRGTHADIAVEVHVRTDIVHFGWTEVTALRTSSFEGKIGVHPSPGGVLGDLRSWIGQDIEIGDEAFDATYLITGKPEDAAKSLLVPSVRDLVLGLEAKLSSFTVEGTRASVRLPGVEPDVAVLSKAIDLVTAAARWQG